MKRTKLTDRTLPSYSRGEEITNMVTHIIGGVLGLCVLLLCLWKTARLPTAAAVTSSILYGTSMIALYTVSSVYHGLRPNMGKKVMQVVDHCTIYFLIAGTYTPILVCALGPSYPALGKGLMIFQWGLATIACVLTAIDLKKYNAFSMVCYIGMGWAIIPFARQALEVMTRPGFLLLLAGGIAYTLGAVLYGVGAKKKWMHSVFHIFTVMGSFLQFLAVLGYAI